MVAALQTPRAAGDNIRRGLNARVDSSTGNILLEADDFAPMEIRGSDIAFRADGKWLRPGSGLKLESLTSQPLKGVDNLGSFLKTEITWAAEKSPALRFQTNIRVYDSHSAVGLEQVFLDGATGTSVDDHDKDKVSPALISNRATYT